MKKDDYVEILLGADKGKIALVQNVDGYRILTLIPGETLDLYREKDLRLLTVAEGIAMKASTRQQRIERIIARGIGKGWSVRFMARQLQLEFLYQAKELMNMAEGDCVRILRGENKGKTGYITLIERQTITVSLDEGGDPETFTRLDLETIDCVEPDESEDELHTELRSSGADF